MFYCEHCTFRTFDEDRADDHCEQNPGHDVWENSTASRPEDMAEAERQDSENPR